MATKREINVVMYGARRAGKSSTLASMIDNFSDICKNTAFRLEAIDKTRKQIEAKRIELRKIYSDPEYIDAKRFPMDSNPTSSFEKYRFSLELKEKEGTRKITTINFHDVPGGGYFEKTKKAIGILKNADVVIVAVDTVYLMEEDSKFSSVFNKVNSLIHLLKQSGFADSGSKLLLLAPLKCEKYYYEKKMREVTDKITSNEHGYGNLIEFLKTGTKKDRVTVAVTPILTMGTVVFDDFKRDENNNICIVKDSYIIGENNKPETTYFKFYEKPCIFSPKYCEQPILYILAFVGATVMKNMKEKKKLSTMDKVLLVVSFASLASLLIVVGGLILKNRVFAQSYNIAVNGLKKEGDGYRIIQNPYDI